ncbi:hypothetical protein [uncultured Thiodictyon sp.]|uniref:hypothetical protein n=1 Tax=uncultured Thiodictyon sp. TaxID=1846217 RepID=UPI0025F72E16|nr:hypothetical protein [uncultured Thiodictyon sp.]
MAIRDTATNGRVLSDWEGSWTADTAAAVYSAWATELGVSDTASVSSLGGTSGFWMLDLGFAVAYDGTCTKIGFAYMGAISIYSAAPNNEAAAAIELTHDTTTETATFTSTSKPSLLLCYRPREPTKTQNCKWQTTATAAILYYEVVSVATPSHVLSVAIKFTRGMLSVRTESDYWPAYPVIHDQWTFDQLTGIGGGLAQWNEETSSGIYKYSKPNILEIRGHIYDENGAPCRRRVLYAARAYDYATYSDADTGAYVFSGLYNADECLVVAIAADGETLLNDKIIRVIPA